MKNKIKLMVLLVVASLFVFTGLAQQEQTVPQADGSQSQVRKGQSSEQAQGTQDRKQLRDETGPNHPANNKESGEPKGNGNKGDQKVNKGSSNGKNGQVGQDEQGRKSKGNGSRVSGPQQQKGSGTTSQMGSRGGRRGGGRGRN